ncbi:MAG: carboxypeptidase regulatory-like domain-containing protein [Thermodesulfobacteriota bacterium]
MKGTRISKAVFCHAALLTVAVLLNTSLFVTAATGATVRGTVKLKAQDDANRVVVYIEKVEGDFFPPEEHPIMDQINLTFVPYVLPVLKGTTVDFHNSDDVLNNIFTPSWAGRKFNLGTYPKGVVRSYTFDRLGEIKLLCNIHPDMEGYILALQNPYFAIPADGGGYRIDNVPPGRYTLRIWYARMAGEPQQITVHSGQDTVADFH